MKIYSQKKIRNKGFTIIEALVLLCIFVIITVTFYKFFASGTMLILEAKKKLVAVGVANERMELIRSLPYGEVGVKMGVPLGEIDSSEDVTRGNYEFHIDTSISYFNDPYDELEDDPNKSDYKKIIVLVSWGNKTSSQTVSVLSIVSPFGEEVAMPGKGTLNISVVDIDGNPVSDVSVHVSNASISYDQNVTTNVNGTISLIGLVPSNQKYIITLGKTGYESSVSTLPPYPTTPFYPTNVHATVVSEDTTNSVFSFSRESDFKLKFVNPIDDIAIPDVNFSMEGGRVLGTNADGTLAYGYNENSLVANSFGEEEIGSASPGQYAIDVYEPGYIFWKTDAGTGNNANEIIVGQGETGQTKKVYLLNEETDSYFVKIIDSVTGSPVEGASIVISEETTLFSDEVVTEEYGHAFFPTSPEKLLTNGQIYKVEISKVGYQDKSGTITIDKLKQDEISIDPL